MTVRYSEAQRLFIINLRLEHKDENSTQLMLKYNSDPISHNRPMLHPKDVNIILKRFSELGNTKDRPKSGRPKTATDENSAIGILGAFAADPHISTRQIARDMGVSQTSVLKVKNENGWKSYKGRVQQVLKPPDGPERAWFARIWLPVLNGIPDYGKNIVFTDEAVIKLDGTVNRQNYRYCSDTNPHWNLPVKTQSAAKVNIWVGLFGDEVIGPFYFNGNMTGQIYLNMLQGQIVPAILQSATRQQIPHADIIYQHDGAGPHFARIVRNFLDQVFPNRWVGRGGPYHWPARSPDFSPLDYFAFGHMRSRIFLPPRPVTAQDLMARIDDFFRNDVTPEILRNVREGFRTRLQMCLQNHGMHFEHLK